MKKRNPSSTKRQQLQFVECCADSALVVCFRRTKVMWIRDGCMYNIHTSIARLQIAL